MFIYLISIKLISSLFGFCQLEDIYIIANQIGIAKLFETWTLWMEWMHGWGEEVESYIKAASANVVDYKHEKISSSRLFLL